MKKILSLILALIMMLSCATMIFAEDTVLSDETPVEVDETASAYYEAVQFLVAYDIMHGKGETLGVYDDIQRYEMALFIARILTGWTEDSTWENGTLNSSKFDDLAGTPADKYYGAISYVNQKGVIEGYGNGKFGPTDGITYQDALAMAVRALGYEGLTYPWGVIETAISLGLTDGITGVVFTDTLKREVVAQIIYNTLFATNKAGTTLAESVFDLSLAWTNIIITKTDAATDDVPANYVGFSILNADGTIDSEVYFVEAAQLGLDGIHDDEKAWGTVYKVMFDTEADFGLNTVIAYESLELETIKNEGRNETVGGLLPIKAFLDKFDIVSAYTQKNFLNTTPEIIIASGGAGVLVDTLANNYYAVDWTTGNILYVDEQQYDEMWACGWDDSEGWHYNMFSPDYSLDASGERYGLDNWIAAMGWDASKPWHILSRPDYETLDQWKCNKCGFYTYSYDQHWSASSCGWIDAVSYGVIAHTVSEVLWYYNEKLDMYFQLQIKDVVDGIPVLGVKYMTEAERAELDTILNTYNYYTYDRILPLDARNVDSETAYASLRVFDINADDVADYGIFQTYQFGIITNSQERCSACENNNVVYVPAYAITDISNTPRDGATNTEYYKTETGCKHGKYWIADGSEVVDGSYVIYGVNEATGEITIVKTINGTAAEDEDNYIGYGYVRAYNVSNGIITISTADGDVKANYNYPALKGSISDAMATKHKLGDGQEGGYPAIANRYLDGFFNQYVEYVMVDGRLVYIELEGASDNLIVVEKYAGIHEDGSIVVWGYEIGAKTDVTKLQQFRINSFNGWAKGDWYNYSWLYEDEIEAAFTRGSVYTVKSYDPVAEGYNVQIMSTIVETEDDNGDITTSISDYNYFDVADYTEITYKDARVGGMSINNKALGNTIERKMTTADKYVFIYDIDQVAGYNAIPIVTYTGIVTNTDAYIKGYRLNTGDGTYIFYIDDNADVVGFAGAAEQGYGLVMFLEWGSNSSYDSYAGKDYLVGATVRTAYVLDLYTSRMKEVTVYPGSYVKANISGESGTLGDGYGDDVSAGFIWFDAITGYVYQTVNGVIVDDTPVDPAKIPEIFAETVTGTNIMTDALVLETGRYLASYNGTRDSDWLSLGFDDTRSGDLQGFATSEINRRMTYKALGTAYKELAPYALGLENKAAVIVNAIKANANGTATIETVASSGARDNYKYVLNIQSGKNNTWRDVDGLLGFFDDEDNATQAYNYSLIYHSDINGSSTAANNKSQSNAVVYLYDFENDQALTAIDPYTDSLVDGFELDNYYEDLDGVASANTSKIGLDNVVLYAPFSVEGNANGVNGAGLDLRLTSFGLDDQAIADAINGGDFTIAFWMNITGYEQSKDPVILATQDWDRNGDLKKGFGLYYVCGGEENESYFIINLEDGDTRVKYETKGPESGRLLPKGKEINRELNGWLHVTLVVTASEPKVRLFINGQSCKLDSKEDSLSDLDFTQLFHNGVLAFGDDAQFDYGITPKVVIDDLVITSDRVTGAEIRDYLYR